MRISDWSSDVCSSDLLFGGCEAALRQNSGVEFRFSCQRKITDLAPWTLAVLLLNRSERFGGGKPVIGKLLRIEPDAHRVGRCEYLDIAHAGHAPQFVHDPRIGDIAEFQRARTSRIRTDCNQEEESRIGLLNRYALPPDLFGQALLNQRQFILQVNQIGKAPV